ncbi:DUF2786 domain-containing protein [Actinomadura xylanilytica]|uniref:DUF2786 domain-containing protein n=1 Tax=Actinomadura xylanilytica TaxID=887459 RepID=UPI00255A75B1|nr:DUF2786 domain-containing protein [Actinomadura xylanilytica]MDL4770593.1 DUF2786 domain-containing protein [Actinomadura xylanilytica]
MRKAWWRPGFASGPAPADTAAETAAELVAEAVRALARGDGETFQSRVAALVGLPEAAEPPEPAGRPGRAGGRGTESGQRAEAAAGWRRAADLALLDRLRVSVTTAWERGWQPADIARYTARRHGPRHRRLVIDAIAAELRGYSAATVDGTWHDQLAALGAEIWWERDDGYLDAWSEREGIDRTALVVCVAELAHLLIGLPLLARIGPPPGTAGDAGQPPPEAVRDVDQRMLGKVRALLAKAESTEFPEEAEALSARAQELMARHSIGHALLAAESGHAGEPAGRRIAVDNPYDAPKAVLLTVVAEANRCRAVWHRELGFSTVLGFPADLTAVEMLFTSLLVQATAAMVHAGPRRDSRGRSRTRSFRHAFLNAYAARIGERLRGAAGEAASRAAAGAGGKDLLPVLAARDRAVEQAVDSLFPNLAKSQAGSVSNYEGWVAGRVAADLASLNGRSEVTGSVRRR